MRVAAFWFVALIFFAAACRANEFQAEGSDLIMGVGPRAMAMGGAVTAASADIYSIYWNPAGLGRMSENEFALAHQLNAELITGNFVGVGFRPEWARVHDMDLSFAFARIPRLALHADGQFGPDDLETLFLRFVLPALPDAFTGTLDSKTIDYRIGLALTPAADPRWSFGLSVGWVKCRTDYCGTNAEVPDVYQVATTDATALSINIGVQYDVSPQLRFGAMLKDINTRLEVQTVVTDVYGTRTEQAVSEFPRDFTIGLSWRYTPELDLSADFETYFGEYGGSGVDFKLIRSGAEWRQASLAYRFGVLIPLVAWTETTGNVLDDLPAPAAITAGLGWQAEWGSLDVAFYPQPVLSYQREEARWAADAAVTVRF